MPDCLRLTCMLVCAFPCAHCTRDRGCSAHPAFPAPSSYLERVKRRQTSGVSRRENADSRPLAVCRSNLKGSRLVGLVRPPDLCIPLNTSAAHLPNGASNGQWTL